MAAPLPDKRGLRLFLSADVAGSTQFKARYKNEKDGSWVDTFQDFFRNFPLLFAENLPPDIAKQVRPWKMLGDEIVFVSRIEQFSDLQSIVAAFYASLSMYRETIRARKEGLDLKSTAWTAGFPYRNKIVVVPTPGESIQDDYLGPDIDTGFRLTSAAVPGPITASIDLAELFLRERASPQVRCLHVGWQTFKGVYSDQPYPIHWLVPQEDLENLDFLPWAHETSELVRGYNEAKKLLHGDSRPRWLDQIEQVRRAINDRFGHSVHAPYYWPDSLAPTASPEGMPVDHQARLKASQRE